MKKDNLSPAKKALLDQWLKGQQSVNVMPGIPRRPEEKQLALSFPQQGRLFLEMLERDTAVNNLSIMLELKGDLNLEALEKSANQIFARHEILRTYFSFGTGLPIPKVLNEYLINISLVDLLEIEIEDREVEARRLAEVEVLKPFDLSQAPLIHLKLYKLDEQKHFLLLIVHHSIADGWSLGVFLKELMILYQANTSGRTVVLPELSIQYFDYAHWQTSEKQQEALRSLKTYWQKQLGGELPTLRLPIDQDRGSRQSFTGGTHRFVISEDLTKRLEDLGRQEDATLFMTLLTSFYLLLHRYSGQDDILLGAPIANRNLPELENLIGVFINTLVLRANLAGEPNFREVLRQVREVSLEAYSHQDLPFEKLVEMLKPKRDLNRTPIFQVVFNMQNAPMPELAMPGLEIGFLEVDRGVTQFDLTLMLTPSDGQWCASVEYNRDLFDPATITRMCRAYQRLLEDVVAHPDQTISEFHILTQDEWQHTVNTLNQTHFDFPDDKSVHQLIEAQVEINQDRIAVVHGEIAITYLELNQRANTLASQLNRLGVGVGSRVGILMNHSLETVVALLGVLKSGGVYVPIHISTPAERIRFILKDADVRVLLTNLDPGCLENYKGFIVNIDSTDLTSKQECPNLQNLVSSDNLVYIIYTSGSFGQPKGVMVSHGSLMNFLLSMLDSPGITKDTVLMSLASISFDISTMEIFLPLIAGAKVVVASEEMKANPILLRERINRHDVNMIQATPATWQLLLDSGWSGNSDLVALCGGDVLTRKMADELLERVGTLWNMYGPTETTVWSMISQVQKDDKPISIGKPIGNTQIYILDRYLQPVPIGVIGELHIAGDGLALAYLNREKLTSEKFIPNIFSCNPKARMYKTGDLARYLPEYSVEVLGRIDDQVKILGNRIELGEIAAVLIQHPFVNDAIVTARKETSGEKRLVAYFVSKYNRSADSSELREFLRKKLPGYMIPSFFIKMDSLPLTSNKKIDRKSLPLPEDIRQLSGYVAPRNEEEQMMAGIWQNVLGVEQIGIHDNFFDLGGASIQSIQVVAKANMYGYKINAENIFEYQTIAELSAQIKVES